MNAHNAVFHTLFVALVAVLLTGCTLIGGSLQEPTRSAAIADRDFDFSL